jgi:hypothetical protein
MPRDVLCLRRRALRPYDPKMSLLELDNLIDAIQEGMTWVTESVRRRAR